MKITCKTLRKKEYITEVDQTDSVCTVLDQLYDTYNDELVRDSISLIWKGKILKETQKVSSLGFDEEKDLMVLHTRKIRKKPIVTRAAEPVVQPVAEPTTNSNSAPTTAELTQEQVDQLLDILQQDPGCAAIFESVPQMLERMRNPQLMIALLQRMGMDPTELLARESTQQQQTHSRSEPQVVHLTRDEMIILQNIKKDFIEVIGGPSACPLSDGQLNSIIYQAYQNSGKNPETALTLLLNQFM